MCGEIEGDRLDGALRTSLLGMSGTMPNAWLHCSDWDRVEAGVEKEAEIFQSD